MDRRLLRLSHPNTWIDLKEHLIRSHSVTEVQMKNDGPPVFCDGCGDPVLEPGYNCKCWEENWNESYILHKSCAEVPDKIHHPIHREHRLTLGRIHLEKSCSACHQDCTKRIYYSCFQCEFNIDLQCASKWRNIRDCDHKFTQLRKPGQLPCEACGKDSKSTPTEKKHSIRVGIDNRYSTALYLCSICQLLVHKDCSWLPSHVNTAHHRHRLKLTWWFEDTFPKIQNNCDLCSDDMEKSRALYYCERERCIYVAHNNCATKHHEAVQDSVDDDDDRIISNQIELQINHFSHQQHVLALINRDHQDNGDDDDDRIITCNGCMRPITESDDFYRCTKQESPCPFFLHTACAQSPKTMPYPFFSDPLKLLTRAPLIGGSFECHMCEMFSQGFVYCNIKEDEYIDLHCTILWKQKPLKHEAHDHNLEFNAKNESTYKCRGCGTFEKKFWFSCRKCDFHLCISCVKLPSIARHRYDNHPLKLTYDSVKNELDEYYCEICEGKRDPKLWFYSCSDCDFDCHPHCILGRYPQVKLGDSYEHPRHPHLVTLVDKRRSEIPSDKREWILPCEKCNKPCEGLAFECSKCNINFHRGCSNF